MVIFYSYVNVYLRATPNFWTQKNAENLFKFSLFFRVGCDWMFLLHLFGGLLSYVIVTVSIVFRVFLLKNPSINKYVPKIFEKTMITLVQTQFSGVQILIL